MGRSMMNPKRNWTFAWSGVCGFLVGFGLSSGFVHLSRLPEWVIFPVGLCTSILLTMVIYRQQIK
jgi:hypothetical protein